MSWGVSSIEMVCKVTSSDEIIKVVSEGSEYIWSLEFEFGDMLLFIGWGKEWELVKDMEMKLFVM